MIVNVKPELSCVADGVEIGAHSMKNGCPVSIAAIPMTFLVLIKINNKHSYMYILKWHVHL